MVVWRGRVEGLGFFDQLVNGLRLSTAEAELTGYLSDSPEHFVNLPIRPGFAFRPQYRGSGFFEGTFEPLSLLDGLWHASAKPSRKGVSSLLARVAILRSVRTHGFMADGGASDRLWAAAMPVCLFECTVCGGLSDGR